MISENFIVERSFHERAFEAIKDKNLVDHEHVALDYETFENFQLFVNYRLGKYEIPKSLDSKFIEEFNSFNFVPRSNADLISEVETGTNSNAPIWPRTSRVSVKTPYVPRAGMLTLPEGGEAIVWTLFDLTRGRDGDVIYTLISYSMEDAKKVDHFLSVITRLQNEIKVSEKRIKVVGGRNISLRGLHHWEDLVLTDEITRSVKEDLEFWIASEKLYKELAIPYRRGYLFEGPPGNGKTAVARTILSTYDFSGMAFNFSNRELDDAALTHAFEEAADSAPALFLMEDIDRLFDPNDVQITGVTKEGLFNCLDGISTYSGVVVLATANHPENLDKAIRHRPGRFDVPVRFDNPKPQQREAFIRKLIRNNKYISNEMIANVVEKTEGKSMAFIKLIYETSATRAFVNKKASDFTDENLREGLDIALRYYSNMETGKDRTTGFTGKD